MATTSAEAPPASASRNREREIAPSGGWSVVTSTAEVAAWDTTSGPPPSSSAAPIASAVTTAICQVPVPITKTSRSATRMPECHAEGDLHGAAAALAQAQAQRDHGGDGAKKGRS